MPLVGGLMEVIVYVQNMNVQVAFYRDTLGFKVLFPANQNDYGNEFWVMLDTGACLLALHGGGQKRFGEDAPKLVFRVADIQATRTELLQRGAKLGEVRSAAPGVWVVDGVDPEGNKLSIESRDEVERRDQPR